MNSSPQKHNLVPFFLEMPKTLSAFYDVAIWRIEKFCIGFRRVWLMNVPACKSPQGIVLLGYNGDTQAWHQFPPAELHLLANYREHRCVELTSISIIQDLNGSIRPQRQPGRSQRVVPSRHPLSACACQHHACRIALSARACSIGLSAIVLVRCNLGTSERCLKYGATADRYSGRLCLSPLSGACVSCLSNGAFPCQASICPRLLVLFTVFEQKMILLARCGVKDRSWRGGKWRGSLGTFAHVGYLIHNQDNCVHCWRMSRIVVVQEFVWSSLLREAALRWIPLLHRHKAMQYSCELGVPNRLLILVRCWNMYFIKWYSRGLSF